jgi:hypothetical protein
MPGDAKREFSQDSEVPPFSMIGEKSEKRENPRFQLRQKIQKQSWNVHDK